MEELEALPHGVVPHPIAAHLDALADALEGGQEAIAVLPFGLGTACLPVVVFEMAPA